MFFTRSVMDPAPQNSITSYRADKTEETITPQTEYASKSEHTAPSPASLNIWAHAWPWWTHPSKNRLLYREYIHTVQETEHALVWVAIFMCFFPPSLSKSISLVITTKLPEISIPEVLPWDVLFFIQYDLQLISWYFLLTEFKSKGKWTFKQLHSFENTYL